MMIITSTRDIRVRLEQIIEAIRPSDYEGDERREIEEAEMILERAYRDIRDL